MELSPEQEQAISAFNERANLFLTGPGGTGKTALIKQMVEICKTNGRKVQVCALTGCAAVILNCQAKTVHSWSGIGLANGSEEFIMRKVYSNKFKSSQWKKIDVLIIDEVSMMSQKIFDVLDSIGRKVRNESAHLPFGGLQLVFSGDFYQLPPVMREEDKQNDPAAAAFCFESARWSLTFKKIVQLKKIFRQTDEVYTKILNQLRVGKLYKSSLEILAPHIDKLLPENFVPTILLPRRRDAELVNSAELAKLTGDEKIYKLSKADDVLELVTSTQKNKATKQQQQQQHQQEQSHKEKITPEQKEIETQYLINSIMADKEIILKKGAQVMCIVNMDMESPVPIVNGSQGIVVDFVGELPLIQFNNGVKRTVGYHIWSSEKHPTIGVKQLPLIYAWAITIHKAQGVSLDMAQIDAGSNIFECGQTYVALSRVKSLAGLYLTAFDPQKIKVNKKVQEFYAALI
jgi:ATP-dependent DNA helicase PIF1